MPQYDENNRGVMFKNDRKAQASHADYQGELDVEGKKYWLNCWIKTSAKGTKFFSLSVKEKTGGAGAKKAKPAEDFPDEDLPF